MSDRVSLFIAVFSLANILACLWLIWWTNRGVDTSASAETTSHVWDGDLTEYNNPLPRWWLGLFIITIVFSLGYLIYYPGLGSFRGTGGWTQLKQYDEEISSGNAMLEQRFASFAGKDLVALSEDASAMSTARNLYAMNCAGCHGSDARGARGFPNLTDGDWLWGGDPDVIYQTIANGRIGVMPPWGAVLGEAGVDKVAAYVLSLSGHAATGAEVAAGKEIFQTYCSACHGVDARGNPMLGAPNLTDTTWLHGGSVMQVRETITGGRNGQMPAQLESLGELKVRLLAAYVVQLSKASRMHSGHPENHTPENHEPGEHHDD